MEDITIATVAQAVVFVLIGSSLAVSLVARRRRRDAAERLQAEYRSLEDGGIPFSVGIG